MLENREGQNVPQVTFRTRRDHEWVDVTSEEIFRARLCVVFSLPGAFTPTCSSTHVPRYNQLVPAFKQQGIDEVVCISVNDAFVMNEWRNEQKAFNVTFMPDGNGDFSRGMGMLVPKNELGFGERSWRYSMLVKDGVIEKMFIEPERAGRSLRSFGCRHHAGLISRRVLPNRWMSLCLPARAANTARVPRACCTMPVSSSRNWC